MATGVGPGSCPTPESEPRWARRGELAAAIAAALWISRAFWWPGNYVVSLDTLAYSGPNYVVTMEAWRRGSLPLWNDFIFGGVAHLANPQTAAVSPLKVIGLLFDTNRAMGLTVALQMVLMAVGAVLLLRRIGARPPFALVGAIVMIANGAVMTRTTQFEQIAVVVWIPWLLLGITAVLATERRSWLAISGLAAATGMILVAGHPQMLYLAVVLAGLWMIGVLFSVRSWTPPLARAGDLTGAVLLGALAAGLHLMALVAGVSDSAGAAERPLESLRSPLLSSRVQDLPRAALGSIHSSDVAAVAGSFEGIATLGVASVITGLVGVVLIWRQRRLRPLAIALAGALGIGSIWALGPRTAVFTVAYQVLPGFDLTRASSRWLTMTTIAASIAVGLGLQILRHGADGILARPGSASHHPLPTGAEQQGAEQQGAEQQGAEQPGAAQPGAEQQGAEQPGAEQSAAPPVEARSMRAVVAVVISGATLIAVAGAFGALRLPDPVTLTSWAVIAAACVAVLVVLARSRAPWPTAVLAGLIVVEIAALSRVSVADDLITSEPIESLAPGPAAGIASRPGLSVAFTDDAFADPAYLRANHRPNTNVLDGVHSLDGYDGGVQITERYFGLLERLDSPAPRDLPLRNQLPTPLEPDFAAGLGLRWAVLATDRSADEIVPGWIRTTLIDDDTAVWENPDWLADAMIRRVDHDTVLLDISQPRPGRIELSLPVDFEVADDDTLVVMRQFAPGWTASIDGVAVPVSVVDGLWLGVDLSSPRASDALGAAIGGGEIAVEFEYRPGWVTPGIIASALGVLGIGAGTVIGLRHRGGNGPRRGRVA